LYCALSGQSTVAGGQKNGFREKNPKIFSERLDKYLESSSNPSFRFPTQVTFLHKIILSFLVIGASAGFFCTQVQARPIDGDIDFGGMVTFDTVSLATATQVTLWNSSYALKDSGDFATFIDPSTHPAATMAPTWIFNSGTPGAPLPGPATNGLWTIGGFTFDLTSSVVVFQSATFLNVTGTGTISSTHVGLDPTPGVWSFSSSAARGQTQEKFGFQANAEAVPENSTLSLFMIGAFGLAAMYGWRRKGARQCEEK
jgi:hypothetical protein